jgi:ssDNA-binding Zn-finger/Zn-ribbon topoisomerase 1
VFLLFRPQARPAPGVSCPRCGAPMVERLVRRGRHAGVEFLACSRFPFCRGTRSARSHRSIARRL